MIWGIIPARAGSKGIKNKNTRMLGGKPLYRWVLDTALESSAFDKIIISTDIKEILGDIEFAHGPNHWIIDAQERPAHLAQGGPNSIKAVVKYVLQQRDDCEFKEDRPDYFALLQPTLPFLRVFDICECKQAVEKYDCDSAQTIRKVSHHDHAYNQRLVKNGWIDFAFPEQRKDVRKQSQPTHYALGNLIMTKTNYFLQTGDFFGRSVGIEIPRWHCIDIDTEDDLGLAEIMLQAVTI